MRAGTSTALSVFDEGALLGASAIAPTVNLMEFSKLLSPEDAEVEGGMVGGVRERSIHN